MRLTFRNNQFVLLDAPATPAGEDWKLAGSKEYVTTNASAAVRFRRSADSIAERVFSRAFVKHYPLPTWPLPSFLDDPHQFDGVKWILTRSRSYLAHAPGAGKTAQAIVAAALAGDTGRVLFIVPPSLTANWERETIRFAGMMADRMGRHRSPWPAVSVVPESEFQDRMGWGAEYIICPDSMLTKPWVLKRLIAMPKRLIAVDEASRFKEATSLRTIALFGGHKGKLRSPGLIQDARHAVLLDGSPMPNRPMELWAPTYAMSPESIDFMSEQDFGFRYCGAKINDWGQWEFRHASHEDELKAKLQKSFMHVVPESALNHPERRRSILFMNEDPRTPAHKAWERRWLSTVRLDDIDEDMNQGEIATRRRELGERKVHWIAKYVSERLESKDESILLFAWHREVCEGLYRALKAHRPALVMGGTKAAERELWFEQFQKGNCKLIIGNIAAMGRGHNLQRANRIIFGEFSWTDELNKQCEKRASRRGRDQAAFVRCDYIVAPGSMDEAILNSVFTKARNVKRIVG
jgi:SWI/SNF-related matrix-associated actin-dependent regulator 1 of chromatin subfamily A